MPKWYGPKLFKCTTWTYLVSWAAFNEGLHSGLQLKDLILYNIIYYITLDEIIKVCFLDFWNYVGIHSFIPSVSQ